MHSKAKNNLLMNIILMTTEFTFNYMDSINKRSSLSNNGWEIPGCLIRQSHFFKAFVVAVFLVTITA
jgi:hypothetical protein